MIDTTALFAQDQSTGLFVPTQARRNVFPWDDLVALAPPEGYTRISTELLSALSVLVAQGPSQGKLIAATDGGSLYTAANVNFITTAAAPAAQGAQQIRVVDPVFGFARATVMIIPSGSGGQEHGPYLTKADAADSHILDLSAALVLPVSVGDTVQAIASVGILGVGNTVRIDGPSLPPQMWSPFSVDFTGQLAANTSSTLIAGIANQRIYVHMLSVGFDPAVSLASLDIHDGVGGTIIGRINPTTSNPPSQDWKGRPLSTGNALEIHANGQPLTFRGTLTYNVGA